MNNTLHDLITLGLENGWDIRAERFYAPYLEEKLSAINARKLGWESDLTHIETYYLEQIIFNVPWAKAVFGEEEGIDVSPINGLKVWEPAWAVHMKQYAPLEDRMKYLAEWLDERRRA